MIVILFILRIGFMMNAGFEEIFNLYNPITYEVGDIIDTYVYRIGLVEFDYSYSTAIACSRTCWACCCCCSPTPS